MSDDGTRDDEVDPETPIFGRFDAATLLAAEGANGGEWAGLGQVLVTFHLLFGEWPEPDEFAESCQLLGDAGLVAYEHDGLVLLPPGRKLLRRAGRHGSAARPAKVAELLAAFDERDLASGGGTADDGPSAEEVAAARSGLTDDVTRDFATLQASNQARLVGPPIVLPGGIGTGAGYDVLPDIPGAGSHLDDDFAEDEGAATPDGEEEEEGDAEPT
jgi:hypothetical protein